MVQLVHRLIKLLCLATPIIVQFTAMPFSLSNSASLSSSAKAADPPNVLDLPGILQQQTLDQLRGVQLLRSGEYGSAKLLFRQSVLRVPHDLAAVYNLACAHALLGQKSDAIEMLQAAVKLGLRSKSQIELDEDLASLREMPEYQAVLKACEDPPLKQPPGWQYQVTIAPSVNSAITVDSPNMLWNNQAKTMQVFVAAAGSGRERLVIGATGPWGDKIMRWETEGTAAGNIGDLYDNHDRLHSSLSLAKFPQLSPIRFGAEVKKRSLDNGPQRLFLYFDAWAETEPDEIKKSTASATVKDATKSASLELSSQTASGGSTASDPSTSKPATNEPPPYDQPQSIPSGPLDPARIKARRCVVIGNSSTAMTGSAFWRSMPRLILTSSGGPELVTQHYTHNHLYLYPEHQDHDPGQAEGVGWGDTYTANTPFFLISQGSSGSDQPLLEAIIAALAAMQPETKAKLREAGLIAPTLQMIFRRCYRPVQTDVDYISALAHPTVFDGANVDLDRMIEFAHAIQPDALPPIAMLQVLKENLGFPNRDYFDAQPGEAILNTPFALARMVKSTHYWHELVVSAAKSGDLNGRALEYHWVILRGDPEKIKIEPIASDKTARRIRVGYHERGPIAEGSKLDSSRVDIALFAHNGVHYSAPAMISINFPANEQRVYDQQQRIVSVDYQAKSKMYVDPALVFSRDWRDDYHYDTGGKLTGWTRTRGEKKEEFNAYGELVVQPAAGDQPAQTKKVSYQRKPYPDGRIYIEQVAQ